MNSIYKDPEDTLTLRALSLLASLSILSAAVGLFFISDELRLPAGSDIPVVEVSLIEELPQGEQLEQLPEAQHEPEIEPEPEPEPEIAPEPEPEPERIIEPPKHKPKPKPKPKPKVVHKAIAKTPITGEPPAKPFGTPDGIPGAKPSGNAGAANVPKQVDYTALRYKRKPNIKVSPSIARRGGAGETVIVRVTVDVNGNVIAAQMRKAGTNKSLNDLIMRRVREIQFYPYMENGSPRVAKADIPFVFNF